MLRPDRATGGFYPAIDALRALAALQVLYFHVAAIGWPGAPEHGAWLVLRMGWVGVDLFLVISGFVVMHSALGILATREPGEFRREFARRRLRRIVPLYLLTLAVFLFVADPGVLTQGRATLLWHLATHLTFTHNLFRDTYGSINGPNWSIGLEMQFYLLVLLAAPWLRRQRPLWVLAAGLAIALAWRAYIVLHATGMAAGGELLQIRNSQLPGTLDEFGVGMALALAMAAPPSRLRAWLAPRWKNFALVALLALGLLGIAWAMFWPRHSYWHTAWKIIVWRDVIALAFGAVVMAAVAAPPILVRALAPVRYLGTISYGIYLWHLPVLLTMIRAGFTGWHLLAFTLIGTLSLAALSWHGFEKLWTTRGRAPA